MRNRNNRIAVRVTNKEFDRINEMVSKSIFPKEKLIRLIIEGYPIQEKPSADYVQLWCALTTPKIPVEIVLHVTISVQMLLKP